MFIQNTQNKGKIMFRKKTLGSITLIMISLFAVSIAIAYTGHEYKEKLIKRSDCELNINQLAHYYFARR